MISKPQNPDGNQPDPNEMDELDWAGKRCGHNFEPSQCPYKRCAYREAIAEVERLRKVEARYRWRPISEIHEDYGECVLMNIDDPGGMELGSNLNLDWDQSKWTHFAQAPLLGQFEYEVLRAAMKTKAETEEASA